MTVAINEPVTWKPVSSEQERFLSSSADEALFGGAAGAGKSDCLVMEALRQISNPRYNGILFRRTYPMLEGADGLIMRTQRWYPSFGGNYNISKHLWSFPTGARIYLAHLEHETDVMNYQGWQLQFIGFDELTHFLETQYLFMFSRNRADDNSNLRCYIRSGTNPGNIGHEWVKKRFITSGVTRKLGYFIRQNNKDIRVDKNHPDAKSRIFIPAKATSNPKLTHTYIANLRQLDETERLRQEEGDWDAGMLEDRIYANFSYDENVTIDAEYDPSFPIMWGVDDGYSNARHIVLAQERPMQGKPDRICIFAEYHETQRLASQSIQDIAEYGYPQPELIYYDPAAVQFAAECNNLGLSTWAGYNNIHEGVKVVRRMIRDHNGERRLQIHPRCEHTIESLSGLIRDRKSEKGGDPVPLKNGLDHGADATRYLIATRHYTPEN